VGSLSYVAVDVIVLTGGTDDGDSLCTFLKEAKGPGALDLSCELCELPELFGGVDGLPTGTVMACLRLVHGLFTVMACLRLVHGLFTVMACSRLVQ
jgi:hypothetical protein